MTIRKTRAARAMRAARAAVLPGLGVFLCLAVAGCGIRTTQVPVDAGAAPSRVPCELPSETPSPTATATSASPSASMSATATATASATASASVAGLPVQIYLVCRSQLVAVPRSVLLPDGSGPAYRVELARGLLDELRQLTGAESEAGLDTGIDASTMVLAPRPGDPADTLRLSREPDELEPYALAQLICTFAGASGGAAARAGVLLGGPGGDKPRSYSCTDTLKSNPEAGPSPK